MNVIEDLISTETGDSQYEDQGSGPTQGSDRLRVPSRVSINPEKIEQDSFFARIKNSTASGAKKLMNNIPPACSIV